MAWTIPLAWTLLAGGTLARPQATGTGSEARPHLLHLSDGRVLRTPAREEDGRWVVKRGADWIPLPPELVTRVVPEAEALRQARRLAQEVRRAGDDPVRRVAYADWLAGEGLAVEALRELDRVLGAHPDHPDARELLARERWPLALPPPPKGDATDDEFEAFCAAAARGGPAYRELALLTLRDVGPIPGLAERLARELRHRDAHRRRWAAELARRLAPGRGLESLLERSVLDRDEGVRRAATLALDAARNPGVVVPLVRALDSRHPELRRHAVEALGAMSHRAAAAPLYAHLLRLDGGDSARRAPRSHVFAGRQRALVMDYDVEVASTSSIADPTINVLSEGSVLDAALLGARGYTVRAERAAVRDALTRLTGADPGSTTGAWRRWWNEHGAEWEALEPRPEPPTTPAGRDR